MEIKKNKIKISLNEENLRIAIEADGELWSWAKDYEPEFFCDGAPVRFRDAEHISHEIMENGVGSGIHSHYEGFLRNGCYMEYAFDTLVWTDP